MARTGPLTAQWQPDPKLIGQRLQDFGDELLRAVRRGIEANAEIMAADLRMLTPRSDGGGPHMADAWKTRKTALGGGRGEGGRFVAKADFAVEVYNADPRFDATIDLKNGGVTSIGRILEYGSRPHRIEAKPGGKLAFFWPAIGDFVVTQSVEHPGTRPYAMMAVSTDAAVQRGRDLLNAALRVARERLS